MFLNRAQMEAAPAAPAAHARWNPEMMHRQMMHHTGGMANDNTFEDQHVRVENVLYMLMVVDCWKRRNARREEGGEGGRRASWNFRACVH